jgi:ATP-dependent Clp protease ATP-binding subunit ClpA
MDKLPTIKVLMKLATYECSSSGFSEIEPEHLLLAILKIADLEVDFADGSIEDKTARQLLEDELAEVRQILHTSGVDPVQLRRALRSRLGDRGLRLKAGVIHRTAEAKTVFQHGEEIAKKYNANFLNSAHLLAAIFQKPTPLIGEVLSLVKQASRVGDADTGRAADTLRPDQMAGGSAVTPMGAESAAKEVVGTASRSAKESEATLGFDEILELPPMEDEHLEQDFLENLETPTTQEIGEPGAVPEKAQELEEERKKPPAAQQEQTSRREIKVFDWDD